MTCCILPNGEEHFLKIRSMVGLIPLFAVETLEPEIVERLPGFKRRMQWFIDNHPDMPKHIETTQRSARGVRRLLSLVSRRQLKRGAGANAGRVGIFVSVWSPLAIAIPRRAPV